MSSVTSSAVQPTVAGRRFSLRRTLSLWLRLPISGPIFRLYARRRRRPSPSDMGRTRVLIANLMGSLGDTVCYLALAEVLSTTRPDVEIIWLADSAMTELVGMQPGVSRVLRVSIPPSRWLQIPTIKSYYKLWCTLRAVKKMPVDLQFDVAIVPRGGVDPSFSAHAVWVLNVPISCGYSHYVEPDDVDHNWGDCLLTKVLRRNAFRHETMRAISLLEVSGLVANASTMWHENSPLWGLQEIASRIDRKILLLRLRLPLRRPIVVISPGAGVGKKAWAPAKFHELCRRLGDIGEYAVAVTGTKGELELCAEVAQGLQPMVQSLAGMLTIAELIGLLGKAALFVGNDSGTGHLSGGLGIPTVSLHVQARMSDPNHISAPGHYRPVGPYVTVVQPAQFLAPCHDRCEADQAHCINQISVNEVWNAMLPYLGPYSVRELNALGEQSIP